MTVDRVQRSGSGRAGLCRRLTATLCLLAVLLALLVHGEPALAAPVGDGFSVAAVDHDAVPDQAGPVAQQHCLGGGHCVSPAILPSMSSESPGPAAALRSLRRQRVKDRVVTPWHRPPSTTDIG